MRRRLFRQFILRPLWHERLRTMTTSVGVALGIAVVIAIQLTNDSSVRGFQAALETVAGNTGIDIVGAGGLIDETLVPSLGWLRAYGTMSPVIQGDAAMIVGEASRDRPRAGTEAVRVLGVDVLRDQPFRQYRLLDLERPAEGSAGASSGEDTSAERLLAVLTDSHAIVTTEKLATRKGLAIGSEMRLMMGDRVGSYVIRGLLRDEGPARVLDGNFILMDIAAAQLAFDRLGVIDRIDVLLPPATDVARTLAEVAPRLPPGLSAERPARRGEQVDSMLAAFHLNLTALSWIALVVGLFLVYNTVTLSVIARRQEIGVLRALGVTRGQVLRLFLGEAAVLAACGITLGLGLARLLATLTVSLTSATVSAVYIATVSAPPDLRWSHVAIAVGMGLPLSLLAAAVPALEASRVSPLAAMRGHDLAETRQRPAAIRVLAPLLVLGVAAWLTRLGPINGGPYFGYLAAFLIVIGASLLVPAIMGGLSRLSRRALRRVGVEGLLAHANLAAAIPRLSISVAALATSLAMMVAIAVMIGSFRETVEYWVSRTLQADIFVGPGVRPGVGSPQTLSPEVVAAVRRHPAVAAVDTFRAVELVYQGNLAVLGAGTFEVVLSHGTLLFKSPANARDQVRAAIGHDAVIVSEPFANKYRVRDGDTITLPTPQGPRPFTVAAVYFDYSNDRGVVVMDRGTFTRYFGDLAPGTLAVYLAPGADADRVRDEIVASLDEGHRAFVYTNRVLRAEVLRVFDSTFTITYALELIAIVVAMLGVAGTLLTLVLERRRELLLLRLTGADLRQVRRMVMIEAAMVGAVSQGIGLVVGLVLSLVLIYVINLQSFGWTIQFRVPTAFLLQSTVVVIVATTLAGVYPARRAARLVLSQDNE